MTRFVTALRGLGRDRIDYRLSGRFDRRLHAADDAIATWTQIMGRQSAEPWLAARTQTHA